MKTPNCEGNRENVTIQNARDTFLTKISELLGVKAHAEGALAKPITLFVDYLDLKGIKFVQQISTDLISEYLAEVNTLANGIYEEILVSATEVFIWMCASEGWVPESVAHSQKSMAKEFNRMQTFPDFGLN